MLGFRDLDRVLRGEATTAEAVRDGLRVPARRLFLVALLLAATYGVCIGFYGLFGRDEPDARFLLSGAVKVPLLLGLTLLVTFPSLYVFNTRLGSRLQIRDVARLLAAACGVLVAILAAFGPIVAFFSVTSANYPFILLLNVAVFGCAGAFGITFLLRTLNTLTRTLRSSDAIPTDADGSLPPIRPRVSPPTQTVFYAWVAVFGLVGAQMSWVLRPFIGSPNTSFSWFRPRDGSFFEAVGQSLRSALFG